MRVAHPELVREKIGKPTAWLHANAQAQLARRRAIQNGIGATNFLARQHRPQGDVLAGRKLILGAQGVRDFQRETNRIIGGRAHDCRSAVDGSSNALKVLKGLETRLAAIQRLAGRRAKTTKFLGILRLQRGQCTANSVDPQARAASQPVVRAVQFRSAAVSVVPPSSASRCSTAARASPSPSAVQILRHAAAVTDAANYGGGRAARIGGRETYFDGAAPVAVDMANQPKINHAQDRDFRIVDGAQRGPGQRTRPTLARLRCLPLGTRIGALQSTACRQACSPGARSARRDARTIDTARTAGRSSVASRSTPSMRARPLGFDFAQRGRNAQTDEGPVLLSFVEQFARVGAKAD